MSDVICDRCIAGTIQLLENPAPWIVEKLLLAKWPLDGRYYREPRLLLIDEPLFRIYANTEKLLSDWIRRGREYGYEDTYVVTYASDSKYCVKTLVSKKIMASTNTALTADGELPYTHSVFDANTEKSPRESGERKFVLIATGYQFRVRIDAECVSLLLVVDEGHVCRNSIGNRNICPKEFCRVWNENEQLCALMKKYDVDGNQSADGGSGTGERGRTKTESEMASESGDLLSALVNGSSDSGASRSITNSGAGTDPQRQEIVWIRHVRIQTDPQVPRPVALSVESEENSAVAGSSGSDERVGIVDNRNGECDHDDDDSLTALLMSYKLPDDLKEQCMKGPNKRQTTILASASSDNQTDSQKTAPNKNEVEVADGGIEVIEPNVRKETGFTLWMTEHEDELIISLPNDNSTSFTDLAAQLFRQLTSAEQEEYNNRATEYNKTLESNDIAVLSVNI